MKEWENEWENDSTENKYGVIYTAALNLVKHLVAFCDEKTKTSIPLS